MILVWLVLLPAVAAAIAYFISPKAREVLLIGVAAVHTTLVLSLWRGAERSAIGGWLASDALGRIVLTLVSVLFLVIAHYAIGYLRREDAPGGRAFASCMLAFLAAASLVCMSHHFALLWIGMETTTLCVAPMIYNRHDRRSLEAVWKYLVLSSVGIAFALLGVFLLATAQPAGVAGGRPLVIDDLIAGAPVLDPMWLRAAFVFMLVGFGTKMGLAPLHAWKPDTYGEAPSLVSGLMAGALTTCAFLGLARISSICFAAGAGDFVRPALVAFGLLSLAIAAAFIIAQGDVKRLLAYSSVEHMGLLALGLGIGGVGAYGAVLHALNNGFAKGMIFLAVGNVLVATGSRTPMVGEMRGLLRRFPISGALLVVGLFAITGSPPFGMFISEFTILQAMVVQHHPWIAAAVICLLGVIFVGIASTILEMVYAGGEEARPSDGPSGERSWLVAGPIVLAVLVLGLGLYLPGPLTDALSAAASTLGGRAP